MIHMRPYNDFENKNIKFLVNNQVDFTTIQITETGLKKSTLDATEPVRVYFAENNLHDYSAQPQGQEHKILIPTRIFTDSDIIETQKSLYRPNTKHGDPRLWIYRFQQYVSTNDIFALIVFDRILYVVNINKINIEKVCKSAILTPLKEFIENISMTKKSVSQELLNLIKTNISGWNHAELMADTGIGRTIESLLGINMNSSKEPDYKGIELKSKRKKSARSTLFSQVPDWNLSKLHNAREIVDKYGYFDIPNHKTLQITLTAQKLTRQNLSLNVDYANDYLEILEMTKNEEQLKKIDDVAVWLLSQLHSRLLEKHKETFWIDVESRTNNGNEYFRISSIEHTKNPLVSQFDLLLEQGKIQLDLMLSRASGNGDTFAFKLKKKDRKYLFPESELYTINS